MMPGTATRVHPLTSAIPSLVGETPSFSAAEALEALRRLFGMTGALAPLPSERDQNFRVDTAHGRFVLKISNPAEQLEALEAQLAAMATVRASDPSIHCPEPVPGVDGAVVGRLRDAEGREHFVRLLTYVPGQPLSAIALRIRRHWQGIGFLLGRVDRALSGFTHPGARRALQWDLRHAGPVIAERLSFVADAEQRRLLERVLLRLEREVEPAMPGLRTSVIHNDGNDHNVLVDGGTVAGLVDFGDLVESYTVGEIAVGIAYAILGVEDFVGVAAEMLSAYHAVFPLEPREVELLPELVLARLAMSAAIAAQQRRLNPANPYLGVSVDSVWPSLIRLLEHPRASVVAALHRARGADRRSGGRSAAALLEARGRHLGRGLTVHYREPVHVTRGWMQYLYDAGGRRYLDLVNNVCHVGHCHPRVVRAVAEQMARLNTNTRYLYDPLAEYLERLLGRFAEPLRVCYLVCSGSEANELALRLARTHTKRRDVIVVANAYHGNTSTLVEMSPYKYNGPGGTGRPSWVHEIEMPDVYRGSVRDPAAAGPAYAAQVDEAISRAERNGGVAAFFCESFLGCGGQIELPLGYLRAAYERVRAAGGVCIADEVQVGFGRSGTHFWGFETQGVVPDIVTLGKPIGNGHPIGAVITTEAIAASFDTGMEYFNTFGGNPVSCAAGLAVLDVVEEEGLQENARRVGDCLRQLLRDLASRHAAIGDVRGRGLFLGVDLVRDRTTRDPAPELAAEVVERLRRRGILVTTEGPHANVLKIKPPLVVTEANAEEAATALDTVLAELAGRTERSG